MNLVWLARNIATSWRYRANVFDFARRLVYFYAAKLPKGIRIQEWTIGFRYTAPIGNIRLLLRANAGSDAFIHSEVFEHGYYRVPLALPPATILDIGANTGLTAVCFGRTYPEARLACVEPVPDNLRVLVRNLELNSINATVIAGAVDVKDGRLLMELGPMDYGHKIANPSQVRAECSIEVAALSIPTILGRLGWARIGLLKIDIEGHEKALFAAHCDWLNLVDAVCIECHEGFGESDLREIAARYGFERPKLLPGIWLLQRSSD